MGSNEIWWVIYWCIYFPLKTEWKHLWCIVFCCIFNIFIGRLMFYIFYIWCIYFTFDVNNLPLLYFLWISFFTTKKSIEHGSANNLKGHIFLTMPYLSKQWTFCTNIPPTQKRRHSTRNQGFVSVRQIGTNVAWAGDEDDIIICTEQIQPGVLIFS